MRAVLTLLSGVPIIVNIEELDYFFPDGENENETHVAFKDGKSIVVKEDYGVVMEKFIELDKETA